jgi:hypothetical protein
VHHFYRGVGLQGIAVVFVRRHDNRAATRLRLANELIDEVFARRIKRGVRFV